MKVIFLKKTTLFTFFFILITFIIIAFTINNLDNKQSPIPTFTPLNNNTSIDINADGITEDLKVTNDSVCLYLKNKTIDFSSFYNNTSLTASPSSWPVKTYVMNLSRKLNPELILLTNNNKKSNISIFQYSNDEIKKIYSEDKNIFGILNLNTSKTPSCYALNSSEGVSSLKSFMISNNEIIDTSKYYKDICGVNNILTFIDLVQKDYEIDIAPDIFLKDINSSELGILWNLNKENFTYSFQDAFFTNDFIDKDGNITSMLWRITFEKYSKGSDNDKSELVFYVTSELSEDSTFKISGISLNK